MSKAMAARIAETGGPGVLRYEEVDLPDPGPGEVLVRHTAIGVNYIDVAFRRGAIPVPDFPATLGMEGAGVVEAVGDGVARPALGDRVSHCMVLGSYAERQIVAADRLLQLPAGIADGAAAAATLQGLTAEYLLRSSYAVQPGDTVLVQAAAGGMGLLLCQWAKLLGAVVIGAVGSDEKAAAARARGCDHVIVYTRESFVDRVKEITDGAGVEVVYDAVGRDTFAGGLDCLAVRGHMVSYGGASGPAPPLDIAALGPKSLTLTRGSLAAYVLDPADMARRAADLWRLIEDGRIEVGINQDYPLADAASAHADLEGRRTTGSTILLP